MDTDLINALLESGANKWGDRPFDWGAFLDVLDANERAAALLTHFTEQVRSRCRASGRSSAPASARETRTMTGRARAPRTCVRSHVTPDDVP